MARTRPSVRRAWALAAAAALAVAGLTASAAPASAFGTVADLGLPTFSDVVVDDTHQQVFVSGGPGASTVEVRGFDGRLKGTVTGQTGASGMALSLDDTALYVALDGAGAVSRIDTTTLAETARYALGRGTCVSSVGFAGTRLVVGYGCGSSGAVALLDLTATPPVLGAALTGTWPGRVQVATDGFTATAVEEGSATSTLRAYDLTKATPTTQTLSTSNDPGGQCHELVVLAARVVAACETPGGTPVSYSTIDMSRATAFTTSGTPVAVATGFRSGVIAAGSTYSGAHAAPDLFVFSSDVTPDPLRTIYLDNGAGTRRLAPRGIALDDYGTTLVAVSEPTSGSGPLRLHVYATPLNAPAVAVDVAAPATAPRAVALTLTGSLYANPPLPAGTTLTVSRTDLAGSHALPSVTTGATGGFSVTDTPGVGGTNTYTVSYAGDAQHAAASGSGAVVVSRVTPLVSIATNATVYAYNGIATVTAHLGPTYTNRVVKIYAQPLGLSRVLVASGTVNSAGNLVTTRRVTRRTTFSAVFDGDFRTAPRTVSKSVVPQVVLGETMSKYYASSGGYYLYRTTVNPTLTVRSTPSRSGSCLKFVAQRYSAGAWRPWATSTCPSRFTTAGVAAAYLAGSHPRGYKFRMRAEYAGDSFYAATTGAWKYFRFP